MNKRFPLQVRIIGLMQNKKEKTYLASVLWSDQNDIIVYRKFTEFKKLHKSVVKKYPLEAGRIKKSDRSLPKFQDISRRERRHARVSKSVLRIGMLQEYCDRLMTCCTKISKDQDVIQFFLATSQDLAPSFSSDSVIVMPSAVERRKTLRRSGKSSAQSITQPVAAESYKSIASYDTKDTKNKPFKVLENETVDVIAKNSSGWWLVENEEKQLAWFPAPYLKKCLDCVPSTMSIIETDGCLYYAVKSYEAKNEDELSMHVGVIVEVLKTSSRGWWLIRYNGKSGFVPSLYLQPYKNPHSKLQILTKPARSTSTPNIITEIENSLSSNTKFNLHRNQANNYILPSKNIGDNIGQYEQTSKSSTNLTDNSLSGDELSIPNSYESDSRRESLCSTGSGNSQLSDDNSLSDNYHILEGCDNVARLFEKNQTVAPERKLKDLNHSGVEKTELKLSPVASTSESVTVKNVIPKIPPRPHRQEILARCTTFTRNMVLRSQHMSDLKMAVTKP
ncbi:NADPH oxidase organizer 1-like [Mustelus asterias]